MKIRRWLLALSTLAGGALGWGLALVELRLFLPLLWAGDWLRALSLSGAAGNVGAWTLVLTLSALPLICLWRLRRRGRLTGAEGLLPLMSLEVFFLLFFLVNPTQLVLPLRDISPRLNQLIWAMGACAALVSTAIGYLVLKLLRRLARADQAGLSCLFAQLLDGGSMLLALFSCLSTVHGLFQSAAQTATDNTGVGLEGTFAVLAVHGVLTLAPILVGCWVLLLGGGLCRALADNPFGQEGLRAAAQTVQACRAVVLVCVGLSIAANLIQLLALSATQSLQFSVDLLLAPLLLSGGLLVLAQYIHAAKAISDDNQSII